MKEGTLYKQGDLEITVQAQAMKYLIRMMLSFKSDNVLATISDVSVDIMNKAAISNQMQIECSPVRYQPG